MNKWTKKVKEKMVQDGEKIFERNVCPFPYLIFEPKKPVMKSSNQPSKR